MFNNRHANLWKVRLLIIPFTLVSGGLFVANGDFEDGKQRTPWLPKNKAAIVISFISLTTYIYAVWGKSRVPLRIRTFLVIGLSYGLIFLCLSDLLTFSDPYEAYTMGCIAGDDPCQILRTSQVIGAITGCLMLLEGIMTGRLGPLDHNLRKHHYFAGQGYQDSANVVIVRPDQFPVQPHTVQHPVQQVMIPMQPSQFLGQHPHPQYEILQHCPSPQSPQATGPSTSA